MPETEAFRDRLKAARKRVGGGMVNERVHAWDTLLLITTGMR
jgi:hypothetical protein